MNRDERLNYIKNNEKQILKNIYKSQKELIAHLKENNVYKKPKNKHEEEVQKALKKLLKEQTKALVDMCNKSFNPDEKLKYYYDECEFEPTGSREVAFGVKLTDYLEKIRHIKDHEEMIILYIKDKKVISKQKLVGESTCVTNNNEINEKIIKKAHKLNANILRCHNHPLSANARFSNDDIENFKYNILPLAKRYKVKIINSVVSEDDYCKL